MSVEIECPTGLKLRIRGLKGKEGRLLSDKVALRQGTTLDNILSACTEEVLDPGPYTLREDGKFDWNKAVVGDRYFTLVRIRVASFGPEYEFKVQCTAPTCRERFDYMINLDTELEVKPLSEEDRQQLSTGQPFVAELPDGRAVKYRLATGVEERAAAKNRTVDRALVDLLAMRILSIEGVGEVSQSDIVNQRAVKSLRTTLEDMEWSELVGLLNQLDSHDCGVQSQIEIQCPACQGVQEVNLPFERTFLLPTAEKTKAMR